MIEKALIFFLMTFGKLIVPQLDTSTAFNTSLSASSTPLPEKGMFRNPLGIPLQLAANFGEIRRDHFHMGLDIRTNARENLPVYAAADGYISRISVSEGGFGNAIYITHFNGYTTVYAHLNNFYDALMDRLKEMQYERKTWEIDLSFNGDEFPVKAGQFIAYSGNTGASGGPHLHFEIRDTKTGRNRNPLLFLDVPDNIPPVVYSVHYYDRNYSTYQTSPKNIPVKKQGGSYEGNVVRTGSDKIIFGIRSEDRSSNSPFMFGIYKAELYVDDVLKSSFSIDDFDYVNSRAVNAAVDHSTWVNTDRQIQFLSKLPGDPLNIFAKDEGVVDLKDEQLHQVRIEVSDIYENRSTVRFAVQFDPSLQQQQFFTTDRIAFPPNKENAFSTDNVQVSFPANAFYDTVPFRLMENIAGGASVAATIGEQDIPVHVPYTVRLKLNDNGTRYKNNVVMQLEAYRTKRVIKPKDEGEWMSGSFNKFGKVQLLVDMQPPSITPMSSNRIANNGAIRISVNDDLGLASFSGELNGKWIMFRKKGNVFTYTVDQHAPLGTHELRLMALDIAGNRSEKLITIERVEKVAVAKKKVVRRTKKKR